MSSVQRLSVKRGDAKVLRIGLQRDLTGVSSVRLFVAEKPGQTLVLDRAGVVVDEASGEVTFTLTADDYGEGKLEAGGAYIGEVQTLPGPLTHPDSATAPYIELDVVADLA